jgi:hypothetical protein
VWNGFCGSVIRRGNRNLLLCALVLLAGLIAVAAFNAKYLASFFAGAHSANPAQLTASNPSALQDSFVRVPVERAIATGVQHITRDDAHPNGYVDNEYLAAPFDNKIMIVRVRGGNWAEDIPAQTFEGRLRPFSADLQSKINGAITVDPSLPPLMPVYLDTVDYKENGYLFLVFGTPILLLALWLLWKYLQYSGDYTRHPFAKRLAKYGQLEMLVQEIDGETSGAHATYQRRGTSVVITQHWLLTKTLWGGAPMRLDHLVWAYRHIVKRKIYFLITVSKWHSLLALDDLGQKIQVQLTEQKVGEALKDLAAQAPQAIYGFDKRLQTLWKTSGKDKSRFLPEARAIVSPQDALGERTTSTLWTT